MFKQLFGLGKKGEESPNPAQTPQADAPQSAVQEDATGGLQKLKSAVSLTGKALVGKIVSLGHADGRLTEDELDEIEETLIRADVGMDMAIEMTEHIRKNPTIHSQDKLRDFLRSEFSGILANVPEATRLKHQKGKLNLYLVVGVNGAGKTTLIGKLANRFRQQGEKVIIAAGDTFRAAAEDQLEVWAQRAQVDLVRLDKADSAAVVFEAIAKAKAEQADVLIIDTAGRLQNKFNLMEELRKVKKIIDREAPADIVYESLLVIDATTGQNALRQAEVFHEAVQLTGVALTKLDSSAKGGIIFNIAKQYHLPVKLVGVGEKIDDLRDFDPHAFIDALFEL